MTLRKKAVVLLSGGLDSATVLAIAVEQGYDTYALSFRYGQRHQLELDSAATIARRIGATRHVILDIDLRSFGGSALTDEIDVPKRGCVEALGSAVPVTYVPARNTIFLSCALGWAEALEASDIFIGVTAVDYSGYPDCRPAFIEAFERLANLATKVGTEGQAIRVQAPLIGLSKAEIIREGLRLGVDYAGTTSCYDPGPAGEPCAACDSCILRAGGFAELGIADPRVERFLVASA